MQNQQNSQLHNLFFEGFSSDEKKQLEKLEESSPGSILAQIKHWDWFATEVTEGYDDSIFEYLNDLDTRYLLQESLDKSVEPLKSKLIDRVKKIDQVFLSSTNETQSPISGYDFIPKNPQKYFWYYRVPKKITKELSIDLDESGRK